MEFGQLMIDILVNVSCKFEMYISKNAQVINENVRIAFLYVLSICMYFVVNKTCLWRFHKGHNQERFNEQRRSSMPFFEIQLVETKKSSQYDTHIHLRVVCEACKQSHVYTEHTVLYH